MVCDTFFTIGFCMNLFGLCSLESPLFLLLKLFTAYSSISPAMLGSWTWWHSGLKEVPLLKRICKLKN
jgi:hypothetical protein